MRALLCITLFITSFLPLLGRETIEQYDVTISVEVGGTLDIVEEIRVKAEGKEIKRGIYRDFPNVVRTRFGLTKELPFQVLEVKRDGTPEPYVLQKQEGGTRIRIGQKDTLLKKGSYTYRIHYRTSGWMLSLEEADELYWNVTGSYWAFPIQQSTCHIQFPSGAECMNAEAYTGKEGEKGQNYTVKNAGESVQFTLTKPLKVGEGWTVSAQIPKGYLTLPAEESLPKPLLYVLGGLTATLAWFIGAWFYVGKDPRKGLIIPQFTAPEEISAGAMRYLRQMRYDNDCFTAGVVGAAQKGAMVIHDESRSKESESQAINAVRVSLRGKRKYSLVQQEGADLSSLLPEENALQSKLFEFYQTVPLEQSFHKVIAGARKSHATELKKQFQGKVFHRNILWWLVGLLLAVVTVGMAVYFLGNTASTFFVVWLTVWTFGCFTIVAQIVSLLRRGVIVAALPMLLFSIPFLGAWFVVAKQLLEISSPWLLGVMVLLVGVCLLFFQLMKAPTKDGRKLLDHLEGLKHYLSVAEKERLNMAAAPPQTVEHFEEFLPYALALGVGENWTESFTDSLENAAKASQQGSYSPSFYTGHFTESHSFLTAGAIGSVLGAALTSAGKAPSSSGSGGGGSSGGGGGGGGGGGW